MADRSGLKFGVFGLSAFIVVIGLSALFVDEAFPQAAGADGYEQLIAGHSGFCLSVENSSTVNGGRVIQAPCQAMDNQLWKRVEISGGYVRFEVRHSGKCLDVSGASTTDGAVIHQWDCHDRGNQQWRADVVAAEEVTLTAGHSGKCVDVAGGAFTNDAPVHQWTCHGRENQRWRSAPSVSDGTRGAWGSVIDTPLVSVAASVLKSGNVLLWSSDRTDAFGGGGRTQTAIFDPVTGQSSSRTVTNTGHDMFCPGIANLPDGRVLVNGGVNSTETSIYDETTGSWESAADMNIGRGYQGTVQLSDGSTFTLGGSWSGGRGGKDAEVFTDGAWVRKSGIQASDIVTDDAQGIYRSDNHLWLFTWSDNRVFHAGPSRTMHWIDTNGNGSTSAAGARGVDGHAMNGTAMMYAPGKILAVGGATDYNASDGTSNAHIIDITTQTPTVRQIQSLAVDRTLHHGVVLPSGEVMVVGGMERARLFHDERSVMVPELFDPVTETFSPMAPMAVPRTYHSVALLLPDATVLTAGGGLCGGCAWNHQDVQIFQPPYLFAADGSAAARPTILTAPSDADHGQRIAVTTDRAVEEFALVRMASSTHSVNNDQRRIPVSTTPAGMNRYTVEIPSDPGIAVSGVWMLFAFDADGVPSVAKMLTVGPSDNPNGDPVALDDETTVTEGDPAVTIDVLANDSDPEGEPLTITGIVADVAAVGSIELENGVVTYTPPAESEELAEGQSFVDRFTYTIADAFGAEATAEILVTVVGADDPEPFVDQVFSAGVTGSNPSGPWSYLWNESSALGDSTGYSLLLSNGFHFDSDGAPGGRTDDDFSYGLIADWGVHPGSAAGQAESALDRNAIIRFRIDQPGPYSIVSSSFANRGCLSAGVDVAVLVNDQRVRTLDGVTTGSFDVVLGTLATGDVVDVAVGPGPNNRCDAYDLDFTITGSLVEPPDTGVIVNEVFGQKLTERNPSGRWSYRWNEASALGDPSGYSPLVWNGFQFDADGLPGGLSGDEFEYGLVARWGAHPGNGVDQSPSGEPRSAIIGYQVGYAGTYRIADSSFADIGCVSSDGVDIVVLVNNVELSRVSGARDGAFDQGLGDLTPGDVVDVAVGPGAVNYCDAVTLDFTITNG